MCTALSSTLLASLSLRVSVSEALDYASLWKCLLKFFDSAFTWQKSCWHESCMHARHWESHTAEVLHRDVHVSYAGHRSRFGS